VRGAGIKVQPLLAGVGLTLAQIDDPEHRINVRDQIAFLEAAAGALQDNFLGFSLAERFDCRDLGLLYYVMASSDTLGTALKRASRYSRITNEATRPVDLPESRNTQRATMQLRQGFDATHRGELVSRRRDSGPRNPNPANLGYTRGGPTGQELGKPRADPPRIRQTPNAQQCSSDKALMRHTAARL
jgi:hypothetical protein